MEAIQGLTNALRQVNEIGSFLDEEIINPWSKVYKEQGQSVMKYEVRKEVSL